MSDKNGMMPTSWAEAVRMDAANYLVQVKFKKLHENAIMPTYAKPGDAGMDLVATSVTYKAGYINYGIGIAVEIPEGFVGLIFPRSSISNKLLHLANSVAVIDSSFRGEILCRFKKSTHEIDCIHDYESGPHAHAQFYEVGDRIAQLMILPYPQISFVEVDELSQSERGQGGFGSSGT